MVEQKAEESIPNTGQGLYLVQKKDGTSTLQLGSIDDAVKEYLQGAVNVRWRSQVEVVRILTEESPKSPKA